MLSFCYVEQECSTRVRGRGKYVTRFCISSVWTGKIIDGFLAGMCAEQGLVFYLFSFNNLSTQSSVRIKAQVRGMVAINSCLNGYFNYFLRARFSALKVEVARGSSVIGLCHSAAYH